MVAEEVRYDFSDHPKYADTFVRNLIRLMILSKLNCSARSAASKAFFLEVVSQIRGTEAYIVNYGQPLLYVKYRGVAFTDQKIGCKFIRPQVQVIDVVVESMFVDFVRIFDNLASSSESQINWGVSTAKEGEEGEEAAGSLFRLLDAFVDSVARLSALPSSSPDSLQGKRFAIRNAIINKKSLDIELLVDDGVNMLRINPLRKKRQAAIDMLMGSSEAAKAIAALMMQV